MKEISQIKKDLAANGYSWMPTYRDILPRVWSQMETYFDDDESVLSALWSSFKRYDEDMVGIVFITSKRTFTLEVQEHSQNANVRYLPFDSYSIEKIQFQPSATPEGLNYVSLQNDSFGNGITFGTPNRKVAEHFIETLAGRSNAVIEVLPDSDDPLLAQNEKEQVVDPDANKVQEREDHKFEEKHEEEVKVQDQELWHKQDPFMEKPVKIKAVKAKKTKQERETTSRYGTKRKNYVWLLWFIFPLAFIAGIITIIFLI
jgi:hypothetical protein